MELMKAGVVHGPRDIRVEDVERPQPGPGEVLVRVALTGICGSDVPRVLADAAHSYPIVLGHEFSGTIEAVGDGVNSVTVGDRVAGVPLVPCHRCDDCQAGNYALCSGYSFIGSRQAGSFAEFVALPARNVVRVDESVPFQMAAFIEPATVALHALLLALRDAERFWPRSSVAVVGAGTIGILLAQWASVLGADTVALIGRNEKRLAAARSAGVEHVLDPTADGHEACLRELTGDHGFAFVFDCVGAEATIKQSLSLASNRGTVCLVGTPKHELTFTVSEWERINRKELWVTGSWMSYSAPFPGTEWYRAASEFASGGLRVNDAMIDATYPLDEIARAFSRFEDADRPSGKILIDSRA